MANNPVLMKEPLLTSVYTGDETKDEQLAAMKNVFDAGLSYFDIHRHQLGPNQKEVAEAFAYFNKYAVQDFIISEPKEARQKIEDGQQPFNRQSFTKLGSFMAQRLGERSGFQKLKSYHAAGAIAFFNDYVEMCQAETDYPGELRFSRQFETTIKNWSSSWAKTNTNYVRRLAITPETDFDKVEVELKKTFSGAQIYPDSGLNDFATGANGLNFFNTVRELVLVGNVQKAVKVGRLAVELYPKSDLSQTALAIAALASGNKNEARLSFKKAGTVKADGASSADNLNYLAYNFASAGSLDISLELLNAAIELYPQEANLYDSLGEFYLRKGLKNKALNSYQKALELNPKSDHAKRMLEKLNSQPW